MMVIDMTTQLAALMAGLDVVLVVAATGIAVSVWHAQRASLTLRSAKSESKLAVVGPSSSAPSRQGHAPSDTSVPEAA